MTRRTLFLLLALAPVLATEPVRLRPPLSVDRDDHPIPKPAKQRVSELYAILNNSWLRHLSLENHALASRDRGALNVNARDEVPDSSWFTNRAGRRTLSSAEILADLHGAPPNPGLWLVERNVEEGYTLKLKIRDSAGRRYWVKFDLPEALERNSGAERISTQILHAAGYGVPFNSIARFRAEDLRLAENAQFEDKLGKRRPMSAGDLDAVLGKLKAEPDGRFRALASLYIDGDDLGKFKYEGTRKDDSNDIIPHELRRELRGLRVIAAWINHADTGDKNTYDAFVSKDGKTGYVKHYLLDFGSSLGSGDYMNGPYRVGHEYVFDGDAMGKTLVSLGGWRRPWETQGRILYPEVGYYTDELFEPEKWKPNYPNLAFVRMDDGDAYWGAKIVTAFSDRLIDDIVASAEYSRSEVARYVAGTLKQRRDLIGRYWLDAVTPLEEIAFSESRLLFRDLAIDRGYAEAPSRKYRCWTEDLNGKQLSPPRAGAADGCPVPFLSTVASPPDRYGRVPLLRVMIQSNRVDGAWAAPVEVTLGRRTGSSVIEALGWYHAPRRANPE